MSCILTVDDRPINRQFLVSLLGYGGHTVLEASGGEEALGIVRDRHPDLVIADVKMPHMDGYEFVDRLRHEQGISDTPVIFYTASYHEREARRRALEYGVADIITKPAEPAEIIRKVNAALGFEASTKAPAEHSKSDDAIQQQLTSLQSVSMKLSALVELGIELASERDTERQLRRFCYASRSIVGARKAALGVLAENGKALKHYIVSGLDPIRPVINKEPPIDHPVLQEILNNRKPILLNHAPAEAHLEQLSPYNSPIQSFLGVPLMSASKVYGWLFLLEKEPDEIFNAEDERMATTLAAQAAIAYENALFSELLQQSAAELDQTRLQQLEMKDQFISHVSHELRSPLAALHQFTTILLDGIAGEINDEQKEFLEIILRNAHQLQDMIGDLLDVTRAEAGKLDIALQSIVLWDLMQPVLRNYDQRAKAKGIELCCGCSRSLPRVQADPRRLSQVLSNLLDNALKFTTQGAVSVSACEDQQPGFVRVTVRDTGCGIPADSVTRVFNRLHQLPNQNEESRKGLGLGLHICQQLIGLHGGRLWAESRLGHGAAFSFTLPISTDISSEGKTDFEQQQNTNH